MTRTLYALFWALFFALPASATVLEFDTQGNIIGSNVADKYPGAYPGGATANSTRTLPIPTGGGNLPVPVAAQARIPAAAVARAAAKRAAAAVIGGPVGAAATAVAVAAELHDQRYQQCPSGTEWNFKFLCQPEQPGIASDPPGTGYQYSSDTRNRSKTPAAACALMDELWWAGSSGQYPAGTLHYNTVNAQYQCTVMVVYPAGAPYYGFTTPAYDKVNVQKILNWYTPQLLPADPTRLETDLQTKLTNDYQANQRLLQEMWKDQAADPNYPADHNPVTKETPVSVTAPPVTGPERVKGTSVKQNPDGSTDTTTTKAQDTVTPKVQGDGTVGGTTVTFVTTTVTTTTTTNNVTNQTTVITDTTGEQPVEEPEEEEKCPEGSDLAACAKLGSAEPVDRPEQDIPVTFSPVTFASSAGCPAPITFEAYGARSISWEPMCDVATQMRPIFLACGALACALIFLWGMTKL